MSLLGGGVASLFGNLFAPLYLSATVVKMTESYDEGGRLRRVPLARGCRAQVDSATEKMQGAEGYTATDRAVFILAATLDGSVDTDCEFAMLEGPYAGTWWRLASPIDRDPGAAYHLARAVQKKAPANG